MPLNNDGMLLAANGIIAGMKYAQTHSDAPGTLYTANVNTGPRVLIPWDTPAGSGNINLASPLNFTGIAANAAVKFITGWSAISGGTCYGSFAIGTGDQQANALGEYSTTVFPINGTAS